VPPLPLTTITGDEENSASGNWGVSISDRSVTPGDSRWSGAILAPRFDDLLNGSGRHDHKFGSNDRSPGNSGLLRGRHNGPPHPRRHIRLTDPKRKIRHRPLVVGQSTAQGKGSRRTVYSSRRPITTTAPWSVGRRHRSGSGDTSFGLSPDVVLGRGWPRCGSRPDQPLPGGIAFCRVIVLDHDLARRSLVDSEFPAELFPRVGSGPAPARRFLAGKGPQSVGEDVESRSLGREGVRPRAH